MKTTNTLLLALAVLALAGCAATDQQEAYSSVDEDLVTLGVKPKGMSAAKYRAMRARLEAEAAAPQAQAPAPKPVDTRVTDYLFANPLLPEQIKVAIRNQWFALGMRPEDLRVAMGNPRSIVRSGGVDSTPRETWWYSTLCVTFTDGVLTDWTQFSGM